MDDDTDPQTIIDLGNMLAILLVPQPDAETCGKRGADVRPRFEPATA